MTAPNIHMIASSLRNCSLSSRERRAPPPQRAAQLRLLDAEVTVNLNSDVAVPYPWEQCLDMRTGEVYYINWKTGMRTTQDPRTSSSASYYSSESEDDESSGNSSDDGDDDDDGDSTSYSSGVTSVSSNSIGDGGETLVAAGCKGCFMYFMVPKRVGDCPKCGGDLLHLGRSGCM